MAAAGTATWDSTCEKREEKGDSGIDGFFSEYAPRRYVCIEMILGVPAYNLAGHRGAIDSRSGRATAL